MMQADEARTSGSRAWWLVVILLVAFRLPSLVQPAGGDQFLYSYIAGRVLDGAVPYRDTFDQKPPGIVGVYAVMWGLWPRESTVAAADLLASAFTAWLLWRLGRRMFGGAAGPASAALFLLLGDPGIQSLGGMYVRAQCETFIVVAVAGALAVAWSANGRTRRLVAAGALCGLAVWLKYNAVMYALPVAVVALTDEVMTSRRRLASLAWLAVGGAIVAAAGLLYFAAGGALADLQTNTIAYNLAYSGETYRGPSHVLGYIATLPVRRAFIDGLWFLGGVGTVAITFTRQYPSRPRLVAIAWIAAATFSIAINGARGLPQYFIQAQPALALAGAAGLAAIWRARTTGALTRAVAAASALLVAAGVWRVGIEPTPWWKPRLFGLPQAVANARFDARYALGRLDRAAYLARFERGDGLIKFSPASVERLASHIRDTTSPGVPVFVFGFASGGVHVKSGHPSASRFFWSRVVVLEFAQDRPGYGAAGLLADLERARPAVVALQKHDWGLAEDVKDSFDFFMAEPSLRRWLDDGYVPDYEDALFSVWRRRN